MAPKLIVMLTYHDVTVSNAKEIFLTAKEAPATCWGFKNVGLPEDQMKDLVDCMHDAGKTVFLESLATDEEGTLASVEQAAGCGFDMLLGGTFFPSVVEKDVEYGIKHLPFVGKRDGGKLYGTIDYIVSEAQRIVEYPVFGINLSGYRYQDGDPDELISTLAGKLSKPLSIAGSVDSYARLDSVKRNGVWAFTIGGAFFENKFGEGFSKQIAVVHDYINR